MNKHFYLILILFFALPFSGKADVLGPKTDKVIADSISKSSEIMKSVVDYSIKGLKDAKDVAVEQAPIIVKEYLKWKIARNIIDIICGVLLIILGIVIVYLVFVTFKSAGCEPVAMIAFIPFVCGIPFLYVSTMDLIYIYCAPRIYVIEHMVELVKKGNF